MFSQGSLLVLVAYVHQGTTCMGFWHRTVVETAGKEALLGCPLAWCHEGQGCKDVGSPNPAVLGAAVVREARNSRVGIRPPGLLLVGHGLRPGYLLGLLLEGGGDGQGSLRRDPSNGGSK